MDPLHIYLLCALALLLAALFLARITDNFGISLIRARRALPRIATRLGLVYVPPELDGQAGGLKGMLEGYEVELDGGNGCEIRLETKKRILAHLCTADMPPSHANEGMEPVDFDHPASNMNFATRFAHAKLCSKLASCQALGDFSHDFEKRWRKTAAELEYSNGFVNARFRRSAFQHYIPTRHVEPMLRDMLKFARILDAL